MIKINVCDDLLHGEMKDRYSPLQSPADHKARKELQWFYRVSGTCYKTRLLRSKSLPIRYLFKMKVSISSAILLAMISAADGRAVALDSAGVDRRSAEGVKYRTYNCE